VDVPLLHERVRVTRTRVERPVSSAPPVRHEGDTLVIPVVEERVVVEKRLFVREEIRITRVRTETPAGERVRVRAEHVEVERIDESGAGEDGGERPDMTPRQRAL
jgi:stress response protein YsnF